MSERGKRMGYSGSGGMDWAFSIFPIIFVSVFILVIGVFIVGITKSVKEWNKNNHSPVLTVETTIVAKRMNVSRRHHSGNDNMSHSSTSSTSYYVTFQVESGDRMELLVPDRDYGLMVEGDIGKLTFQGTRFKGFERIR